MMPNDLTVKLAVNNSHLSLAITANCLRHGIRNWGIEYWELQIHLMEAEWELGSLLKLASLPLISAHGKLIHEIPIILSAGCG